MIKKLLFAFLLITSFSYAQYNVKGELERYQNYPWMILYELNGSQQNYIAYDSIKKGQFSIDIPAKQAPGMYRLMYDVKNKAYVDFLFDNENVVLSFNPKSPNETIQFSESKNNRIYREYIKQIQVIQQELDSLQIAYFTNDNTGEIEKNYESAYAELNTTQNRYEELAMDKLAAHFVKASARFYEKKPLAAADDYMKSVQTHFFDAIDFNDKALLGSTFIHDKINAYLFHLNTSDDAGQLTKLRKNAITTVIEKIGNNYSLSKDIQEGLLYAFAGQEDTAMVNFVMDSYAALPKEHQDLGFVNDINGQLKTATGMLAPNITWQENGIRKDLHSLRNATHYVIVFWSSTCGHCLQEMPLLYDYLEENKQVKIIAIGLEDNDSKASWQTMIKDYPNFSHVYGKDKWKNNYAAEYGVNATPSFYVLDAKKKVVAKPDDVAALKVFFGK